MRENILVTGGAGFFGSILKKQLIDAGYDVVVLDLEKDTDEYEHLVSVQGDIRDETLLGELFEKYHFTSVVHLAAFLAHEVKNKEELWSSNVEGTKCVRDACINYGCKNIAFTSSNCLWAEDVSDLVPETKEPNPVEIYGKSKWEGEKLLQETAGNLNATIFRCPTIIDEGRLGLLALLFEFIDEDRKVPMVGKGENRYQFIYAKDLGNAIIKSLHAQKTEIYNIGSDNVKTFNEVYQYVIDKSGSKSRLWHLPKGFMTFGMKVCHFLHISPLGPYQYKMIAASFVFDTSKIKRELGWEPTLSNEEMLYRSYEYYKNNREEIEHRTGVSAHKRGAKAGVIRLLKHFC